MNALCAVGSHDWVHTASPDYDKCNRPDCRAVKKLFNSFELGLNPVPESESTMTKQPTTPNDAQVQNDAQARQQAVFDAQKQPAAKDFEENKTGYVNEIEISGTLTKPVEYRLLDSGREMAKVTMRALNPGNKQQDTLWFSLIMWHNPVETEHARVNTPLFKEFCTLSKGSNMVVIGRFSMYGSSPQVTIQGFDATPPRVKPATYEIDPNNGGYPSPD